MGGVGGAGPPTPPHPVAACQPPANRLPTAVPTQVGTHRFGAGKTTAYEEDLRVPFIIKGPGIKASRSTAPTNNKARAGPGG